MCQIDPFFAKTNVTNQKWKTSTDVILGYLLVKCLYTDTKYRNDMQHFSFSFKHHTNVRCIINSAWETVTVQGIWSLWEWHTAFVKEIRPWMTMKQLIAIDRMLFYSLKKHFIYVYFRVIFLLKFLLKSKKLSIWFWYYIEINKLLPTNLPNCLI